jgi:hypothetical protein
LRQSLNLKRIEALLNRHRGILQILAMFALASHPGHVSNYSRRQTNCAVAGASSIDGNGIEWAGENVVVAN